jgi:hypothetical protein
MVQPCRLSYSNSFQFSIPLDGIESSISVEEGICPWLSKQKVILFACGD